MTILASAALPVPPPRLKRPNLPERTGEDRANAVPGTLSKFFLAGQRFVERLQGPVSGGS